MLRNSGIQDGYGSSIVVLAPDGSCDTTQGESAHSNDCDDSNNKIHPLAEEICDGRDNNCNNEIVEGLVACERQSSILILILPAILSENQDGN